MHTECWSFEPDQYLQELTLDPYTTVWYDVRRAGGAVRIGDAGHLPLIRPAPCLLDDLQQTQWWAC